MHRSLVVWDLETGRCAGALHGHHDAVTSLALGEKTCATGGYDGRVCVFDVTADVEEESDGDDDDDDHHNVL